ncbi:MAG: flagellin [Desulfarculales bacterium]|nr:flagellin [Desulfarculales bacterium]
MSLVINHNMMAMNAARNLGEIYDRLSTSTRRLSSGLRVGTAADDAAGLAIREMMRTEIATINQGIRNASDAISMIQTAEGAMSVIDEKLTRMKELAEQAATGTYTTAQREIINSEYQAMAAEIDRIANATDFNGVKLLDGTMSMGHEGSGMKIHFGTGNDAAEDYYYINTGDVRATYASGLRVGNSDPRDTLRTNNLRGLSPTTPIEQGKGEELNVDGYFGIRFTENFDAEHPTDDSTAPQGAKWQLYGYVDIDASRTSINDIVQEINKGAQAQGTMTLGVNAIGTSLLDNTITINGKLLTFTAAASSYNTTTGTGNISLTAGDTVTDISTKISNYLNAYKKEIGVYAAKGSATTVHLIAYKFGEVGNSITTNSNFAALKADQETLKDGGRQAVTAMAYYNADRGDYELQLQMNRGGEKYQVQTFGFATIGDATAPGPMIMGGLISGSTFGTDTSSRWMAAITSGTGSAATLFAGVNERDEWLQPQNGSGTTDWDGADVLTQSNAQRALSALDAAVLKKDTVRAQLGSIQNRLENTITNLQIQAENLQAAESRISDVDVATEMTEFTRNNILAQAATAMLAQANALPQLALQLIGG